MLVRGDSGSEPLLAAILSDAGQQSLFDFGRASMEAALVESCFAPEQRAAISNLAWIFLGPEAVESCHRDDFLAQAVLPRRNPSLPLVVAKRQQDNAIQFLLHLPDDLSWFEGHFPGDPILPAVVQISWVMYFSREFGFSDDSFKELRRLKFLSVISPDTVIRLTLTAEGQSVRFTYESAGAQHSKGVVLFGDAL
jgi:3-hydroxymyristoyl/3-hydroxydecanoyl-(acyl carrier protein) dehydratase